MALPEIMIICDNAEKQPWIFEEEEKKPGKVRILGTEISSLNTADYTIKGMENFVLIERKSGLCELVGNMTPIAHKERFEREMERMSSVKYKYILIESTISKDILGLSVQQFKFGLPTSKVVDWLLEIQIKYGVCPIFVGDAGKKVAKMIFNQAAREFYG